MASQHTAMDVKAFLNDGVPLSKQVSSHDFLEFWRPLSDEEKDNLKMQVPLQFGRKE